MPIGTRSERIELFDAEKLAKVNAETLQLWHKYEKDMKLRELSEDTIYQYYSDLRQWWLYIYDEQQNRCVTELDEDDITDFLYFCKEQGNNSRRLKRRISSLAAFYKFLRKKKIITVNPMEGHRRALQRRQGRCPVPGADLPDAGTSDFDEREACREF